MLEMFWMYFAFEGQSSVGKFLVNRLSPAITSDS